MLKSNHQKVKLLLLMEFLQQDSDENNPLKTRELKERLEEWGISCDRRTIAKDMEDLREQGYEIMSTMCGHEKGYYIADRKFSVPELRILIDAVQSANFISPKKTEELMQKIAALGGSYQSALLQKNTVFFANHKHSNETVYYTIDTIERAFSERKKVSFNYYDLDENREKVYRKEKKRYVVEPVHLVLFEDRYYLTALSRDRKGTSIYRIDRMEGTEIEKEKVTSKVDAAKKELPDYKNQVFNMFVGRVERITLEFEDHLMGAIYDQFGENADIVRISEDRCMVTAEVQMIGRAHV